MTSMRLRILVVDDEADLRAAIAGLLEQLGHDVFQAGDAESALDRVATETFDGVILDNNLPGIMGITALPRFLKAGVRTVIMVTGHATEEIRQDALLLGAKCLLDKPLDFDVLADALSVRR
ncbi:MAG: response regulator [Elusimicrobiota bacterium]